VSQTGAEWLPTREWQFGKLLASWQWQTLINYSKWRETEAKMTNGPSTKAQTNSKARKSRMTERMWFLRSFGLEFVGDATL
jgi:hypothetical protein